MNVEHVKTKLTPKTKAIMAVHIYGHPADMDPIMEIAEKHGIWVVEDAAEAHGAEYKGRKAGSLGHVACFSFYANKIITTGEGGMLVTNDEKLAERAKWLRSHAFGKHGKHFWHEEIGFGYRMSALQAALGVAQMEKIEKFVEMRRQRARLYNSMLRNLPGVTIPAETSWAKNVYRMYSILIEPSFGISRDAVMQKLDMLGVESRTFFYPIHLQPAYRSLFTGERYPAAEELSAKGINLPSGNDLSDEQVQYVCDSLRKIREGKV